MAVVVKNVGINETGSEGQFNTNPTKSFGDQGTVRVVVHNHEHVFGPNQSKTFHDDGIGHAVAAADARLRVMDTRDASWPTSNASILQHIT